MERQVEGGDCRPHACSLIRLTTQGALRIVSYCAVIPPGPEDSLKNLLGRLMSRPFEELKGIADTWGALTRDPSPSHNDLAIAVYHAMVDPSAARSVWESMDPD